MNPTPTRAETPRTDAAEKFGVESDSCDFVHVDFARQLERELATAQARIAELEKRNSELDEITEVGSEKLSIALCERDEWRDQLTSELTTLREKLALYESDNTWDMGRLGDLYYAENGAGLIDFIVGHMLGLFNERLGKHGWNPYESDGSLDEALEYEATSLLVNAGVLSDEDYSVEHVALREKLAEEQAGAASMRETLAICDPGAEYIDEGQGPGNVCCELCWADLRAIRACLASTTGKATLEELERLRAAHDDMREMAFRRTRERDTALARVKTLEGALRLARANIHDGTAEVYQAIDAALQPTAPTEPEKATNSAPPLAEFAAMVRRMFPHGDYFLKVNMETGEVTRTPAEKAGSAEPQPSTVPLALALAEDLAERSCAHCGLPEGQCECCDADVDPDLGDK